jgi:hypothetical protein
MLLAEKKVSEASSCVLKWTVYNGTLETLPNDKGVILIIMQKDGTWGGPWAVECYQDVSDPDNIVWTTWGDEITDNNFEEKVRPGHCWAYIPFPE